MVKIRLQSLLFISMAQMPLAGISHYVLNYSSVFSHYILELKETIIEDKFQLKGMPFFTV